MSGEAIMSSNFISAKTVGEVLAEYSGRYKAVEFYRVERIPNILWCEAEFIGFSVTEAGDIDSEFGRKNK